MVCQHTRFFLYHHLTPHDRAIFSPYSIPSTSDLRSPTRGLFARYLVSRLTSLLTLPKVIRLF